MSDNISLWKRILYWYLARTNSRYLAEYELVSNYNDSSSGLAISFSGMRRLLSIELYFRSNENITIDKLRCSSANEKTVDIPIAVNQDENEGLKLFRITPHEIFWTDNATVILKNETDSFEYNLRVQVVDDVHADFELLRHAVKLLETGQNELVVKYLADYQEKNNYNPHAYYFLAIANHRCNNNEEALNASLHAMGRGLLEQGTGLFRSIKENAPKPEVPTIRKIQQDSHTWQLPGNIGLISIEKKQEFTLGYGNCFFWSTREMYEVKRSAAARMLRSLSFPLSTQSELLLHTAMYIIHRDDSVETVPIERFQLTDADNKDFFITVEDDKEGHWILPDLEIGDVIAWTYDIIGKCFSTGKGSQFFRLIHPFDTNHPTFRGSVDFTIPAKSDLQISELNWSDRFIKEESESKNQRTFKYIGTQVLPVKHSGFNHEDTFLNPVLAAGSENHSWSEVADQILNISFGGAEPEDNLPPVLQDIIKTAEDRISALETAFYWVRDKLKYASLESAQSQIGVKDRAAHIIQSGNADCKDRAYLMRLLCDQLEYPCHYVLVSSKSGIIAREVPANQFDHAFVRVETEKGMLYLDPTNSGSVYETTPFWCQGLDALIIDKQSQLERIPEDSPEHNVFEVHESIEAINDGWLEGSFDIVARGHIGRSLNESWKSLSLTLDRQEQAATEALRRYLPASVTNEFEKISDTSSSTVFHVTGLVKRCRLMNMQDAKIGTLQWLLPFLPISYWRVLNIDKMFVFNFPCRINLGVTFGPKITPLLKDFSRAEQHQCDIGQVTDRVESRGDLMTIHRSIQINQRFVTNELTRQVPELLDKIEGVLRLAITLKDNP